MGTGTGHALTVLSDCVGQATGFDMSLDMLAVARANLEQAGHRHCMVRQGDITQLPLGDGVTDCAVIHQVLHYMPDPALVVGEAARILKPGGHVLAVDYAPHGEEWLRDQHAHRRLGFQDEEVHRWFDAHGLFWQGARRIKGPKLDVVLWTAQKPVTH
jgi:ArsR family transcriptional regulator